MKSFSLEQFVVVANIIRNIVESSFKDEQRWQEFRGKNVNDYDEETEAAFQKLVGVVFVLNNNNKLICSGFDK